MAKINLTYVLCKIGGFNQYLWIADAIDKNIYSLSFIFLDETTNTLGELLTAKGFNCYRLNVTGKKDIPKAIYQSVKIFKKEKTTVVHTHLVDASLVGLIAARLAGIRKRIHTRHHADFHHEHYQKGVILDNLINFLSTDIIVISRNVKSIVETKEKFHRHKTRLIYHGFKLQEFDAVPETKVLEIKSKYKIDGYPVIGMISRYETGKGIEYCIAAFNKLLPEYPEAKLVIANAFGADKKTIQEHLSGLPADRFTEIEYEKEITALYKCFDIFVHVPVDASFEAFGQVYIEAMAASVPGVYTLSGIASEYIKDGENALVTDYRNSEQIYTAIKTYLDNPALRKSIIAEARISVSDVFDFDKMMSELNALYLN